MFGTRGRLALLGALALPMFLAPQLAEAQDLPRIGNVTFHIRSISPHTGPIGTAVRVEADGLPPNRNYQLAIGEMQGCGYQVCKPARTNSRGELTATVDIPDWAHTDHYELFILMDEAFTPVAISDPFHVSDTDGLVERQGEIGIAWPGCASLIGDHGVTYALVGPKARTLMASEGHTMIIKGRIVEGVCAQGFGIEVESMEMTEPGE